MIMLTPAAIAQRFIGQKEIAGDGDNPLIVWMLNRLDKTVHHDEVAWCSAFAAFVAFLCGLTIPTVTLGARSWLRGGTALDLNDGPPFPQSFVVVVFKRGPDPQPDATVIDAPGHVGIYVSHNAEFVWVCGGNQGNAVSVDRFLRSQILSVRAYA